jgi:hypothetical protein
MRHSARRWLIGSLLTLGVVAGGYALRNLRAQTPAASPPAGVKAGPPAAAAKPNPAPSVLRLSRNIPGDAKPIQLEADALVTWTEGGSAVLLMKGMCLVEQNIVQARFERGVAFLDVDGYRASGVLGMQLYAEGKVRLDNGSKLQEAGQMVMDLHTRGEFKVRSYKTKVLRQNLAADPLVARARAVGVVARGSSNPATGFEPGAPLPIALPSSGELGPVTPPPAPIGTPPASGGPASGTSKSSYAPGLFNEPTPRRVVRMQGPQDTSPGPTDPPPPDPPPGSEPATPAPLGPPNVNPQGPPAPPRLGSPSLDPRPTTPFAPAPDPPAPGNPPPPTLPVAPPAAPPVFPSIEPPPGLPPPAKPGLRRPLPPPGEPPPAAPGPPRQYTVAPRGGTRFNIKIENGENGERVIIVTGGAILGVRNAPGIGFLDLEADRIVIWTKGGDADGISQNLQTPEGVTSNELEFYLAGGVEIRQQGKTNVKEQKVLRADEVYYDVNRNVAVALKSQLEIRVEQTGPKPVPLGGEPLILSAAEVLRLNVDQYQVSNAEIFSSKLPSDPGLKVLVSSATVDERDVTRKTLFGQPIINLATGQPLVERESIVRARNVVFELEGVPFFYLPYAVTDAREPLGPLEDFTFGYSRIFGTQIGVGLNAYKVLGLDPIPDTKWKFNVDYLSNRGPALGTSFNYSGKLSPVEGTYLNPAPKYVGEARLYGLDDRNFDNLGGNRPNLNYFEPEGLRGRAFWKNALYDLPNGYTVQNQLSWLSDRNFVEQYFKREFDTEPNQATWLYVEQQHNNLAWTALVEPNIRNWTTETVWLPRVDGYVIGQSFLDMFSYSARADATYARLHITRDQPGGLQGPTPPPPDFPLYVSPTDLPNNTGRFGVMQELSLPFTLGAFRVVPYATLELAEYTNNLNGDEQGRVWGGGGLRGTLPLTRLYAGAQDDMLNINGINHKIVCGGNFFYAQSNEPYTNYAQLDRLNDDVTDQTIRDFRPVEPLFNTANGYNIATNKLFDPQTYAIRRLVLNRIDTLNAIEVLQMDINQRWQTKRGYPGSQHIIDWMTLDTSISYFPQSNRDNFGHPFAFLEYRYLWNIGDRTALESTGWVDPYQGGPSVFTVGAYFNRPDRTNFYLGFRDIPLLQSQAVTGSVTYIFSPKYAMTFTTSYDFGTAQALNNSLMLTRIGADLQVSFGVSYNAFTNNFSALFEIVPNLVPLSNRFGPVAGLGAGGVLNR